jgi:hypothetical protein
VASISGNCSSSSIDDNDILEGRRSVSTSRGGLVTGSCAERDLTRGLRDNDVGDIDISGFGFTGFRAGEGVLAFTTGIEVVADIAARADADRSDEARGGGGGGGGGLVPNDPKAVAEADFLPSEDCPLRSLLDDRLGGIGGAGPFVAGWKGTILIGWGTGNFANVSGVVGS